MKRSGGWKAKRFRDDRRTDAYIQITCAALTTHLDRLEYAAESDPIMNCHKCHEPISKWVNKCPLCNRIVRTFKNLVETVAFCESELALSMCLATDIEYEPYIRAAQKRFRKVDEEIQIRALEGAKEWWKEHDTGL